MNQEQLNQHKTVLKEQVKKFESKLASLTVLVNQSEAEAVKQLILVTTIFLSVSFFAIQTNDIIFTLSQQDKISLIWAWISFAISLLIGVFSFVADMSFYKKWADAALKTGNEISIKLPADIPELNKLINKNHSHLKYSTSSAFFASQVATFISGVGWVIYVAAKVLMS